MPRRYISLTFKITAFATAIILLMSLFVAMTVYLTTHRFFFNVAVKHINNQTRLISNDIENALIKITNDMQVLSRTPPIQGIVRSTENAGDDPVGRSNLGMWRARLETIFTSMLVANPNYTQIRYLTVANRGQEVVRVDQNSQGVYGVHASALQQKADRDYFKLGVRLSKGSVLFSPIDYNAERGKIQRPNVVTLRVLSPVYTDKQRIFGLLIINVNIARYLHDVLLRMGIDHDVILIDSSHNLLIFNHKTKKIQFIPHNESLKGEFSKQNVKQTDQLLLKLKNDPSYIMITHPIYSNHYKDHQILTLMISVPRKMIERQDERLVEDILIWVIAGCLVAALLIFLFTRYTMQPLSVMAKSIAESVRVVKDKLYLPVQRNDEVGLLARAFESKSKMLNQLALFDSLTGLANRKKFIDYLEEAIQRSRRDATSVAILYLDINKFKQVNDTYGHDYGDALLIQFSSILQRAVRDHDFCARIGGDEFGVIIEGIKASDEVTKAVERFQSVLNISYVVKGVTLSVSVAGGVAMYPNDSLDIDELMKMADDAMYRSKKEARGVFHFNHSKS